MTTEITETPKTTQPEDLDKELERARKWATGGLGAVPELFTGENFPILAERYSSVLDSARKYAERSLVFEIQFSEIKDKYPEIYNWPVSSERETLLVYALMGLGDEALEMIKNQYKRNLRQLEGKPVGFGVK